MGDGRGISFGCDPFNKILPTKENLVKHGMLLSRFNLCVSRFGLEKTIQNLFLECALI